MFFTYLIISGLISLYMGVLWSTKSYLNVAYKMVFILTFIFAAYILFKMPVPGM